MKHPLQPSPSVRVAGAALLAAVALGFAPEPAPGTVQAIPPVGSPAA